MAARKRDLTALAGVRRDLAAIGRRDKALAESGLAATALQLARSVDDKGNSATSRAMCARALLDTLNRLWELAPAVEEADRLDELSSRRATRIAGDAKTKG